MQIDKYDNYSTTPYMDKRFARHSCSLSAHDDTVPTLFSRLAASRRGTRRRRSSRRRAVPQARPRSLQSTHPNWTMIAYPQQIIAACSKNATKMVADAGGYTFELRLDRRTFNVRIHERRLEIRTFGVRIYERRELN